MKLTELSLHDRDPGERLVLGRDDEKGEGWAIPQNTHQSKFDAARIRTLDTGAGIGRRRSQSQPVTGSDAKVNDTELGVLITVWFSASRLGKSKTDIWVIRRQLLYESDDVWIIS